MLALPFDQRLDIALLRDIVAQPPATLVQAMVRAGIDILVVPSSPPTTSANALYAGLRQAPPALLQLADFHPHYEGQVILRQAGIPGLQRDTILIRDTAPAYTLIHEFAQSRLVAMSGRPDDPSLEQQFSLAFHRLQTYQRRLYDDPFKLLDPLWRRDILAAQHAVAERLFDRIRIGQSQEAIIEKLLRSLIDARSPYHDAARREQGRRYGEAMIDNAIDVFNAVNDSVVHSAETVRHLREQIEAGAIDEPDGLSAEAARAFASDSRAVEGHLARVRTELLALKRFYAAPAE